MEAGELRRWFVEGVLALGGAALVFGYALSRVMELARSEWDAMAVGPIGRLQTSPVRHRTVTGRAYGERRR
jgi:hypothetical protein